MNAVPNLHYPTPAAVEDLAILCPRCGSQIGAVPRSTPPLFESSRACAKCSFILEHERGIWIALPPERASHFARFITEYQMVRAAEGRGSAEASFYLALPYRDVSGRNQAQWTIRAQSYRCIEQQVLRDIRHDLGKNALDILDLGAGNGWLSYRLALAGHRSVAVDLLTNGADGLGAASHYLEKLPTLFARFQAQNETLPFADAQFDCAIFNASFHYSENYTQTLKEALRCIRPGGAVVICDTPWYSSEDSGQQMVREKRAGFQQRFGFLSDGLASLEYLTDARLHVLEDQCSIKFQAYEPDYGVRWAMRPVMARIRGQREPSTFKIYVARVTHS